MRIALCISGQMRTYKKCYDNLAKYILKPYNPDVFVHVWDYTGSTNDIEKGEKITSSIIENFFHPVQYVIDEFKDKYYTKIDGLSVPKYVTDVPGYKGTLPMYYKMFACNQLKCNYEKKHNFKYDVVIRIRPDLNILKKLPRKVLLQSNLMWTSGLIDTRFRYDDRLAISNSENMNYYTSVWERLNTYWKNPLGDGYFVSHRVGDQLMKYHLGNTSIEMGFFYIPMHVFRGNAFIDSIGIAQEKYVKYARRIVLKQQIVKKFPNMYRLLRWLFTLRTDSEKIYEMKKKRALK